MCLVQEGNWRRRDQHRYPPTSSLCSPSAWLRFNLGSNLTYDDEAE